VIVTGVFRQIGVSEAGFYSRIRRKIPRPACGRALAPAMSLPASAEKSLTLNMTFGVVAFSILVQGSTIGIFFKPAHLKGLIRYG